MTTPENIEKLNENEIFVFGSNLNGSHGGGAALLAKEKFGAVEGMAEGLAGQCYAFPTLDAKMKKVTKKSLAESKAKLYACAAENPDKTFLVTKLGCGIAGFSEDEMKKAFKGEKPKNVVLPAGWAKIRGYKAFEKGLKCRGFQYESGETYTHKGRVVVCESGWHAVEYPLDVFGYYAPADSRYAEVTQSGKLARHDGDSKIASAKITIGVELHLHEIIQRAVKWVFDRAKPEGETATGYQGAASSTGDRGAASSTGTQGAASSTGYQGAAMAAGVAGRVQGAVGNALFLVYRDQNGEILHAWAGIAGRDGIKPLTFYTLGADGKPVEVAP